MSNPSASLMALPTELQVLTLSHLEGYDIHNLSLTNRHFASITPWATIRTLPRSLHEQLPSYLEFWDIHALRLTNRYFARVTPPLPSFKEMDDILTDMHFANDFEYDGAPLIEFNESWMAITSNAYFALEHGPIDNPWVWRDSVDGTGGASVDKRAAA